MAGRKSLRKHRNPKTRQRQASTKYAQKLQPTNLTDATDLPNIPLAQKANVATEIGLLLGNRAVQKIIKPSQTSTHHQVARQSTPSTNTTSWATRFANAAELSGATRHEAHADLMRTALNAMATIHQNTNGHSSVAAAARQGAYVEYGSIANPQVNYDERLNAKSGMSNLYGYTYSRTVDNEQKIYVILGPQALNPVGPIYTQMALQHEQTHVQQMVMSDALGESVNIGADQELEAYVDGFAQYVLPLIEIDRTTSRYYLNETFMPMFQYYAQASESSQDATFTRIQNFYTVRIRPIALNRTKFRIWLQQICNARPATDELVQRINSMPGLGLTRGTEPAEHL